VQYFDHNATHPLSLAARQAWLEGCDRFVGNPSSPHRLGDRADKALNDARDRLAAWLGCDASEIVWTSGATEAVNTAVAHLAFAQTRRAWLSSIEHPCVLEAVRCHFGKRFQRLPVSPSGVIDIEPLRAAFAAERPAFVALMAANNETGILQPWRDAQELCHEYQIPFLCDAAQWIGKRPAAGLGACDFVAGCAHKFGGPPGVGFLKCPESLRPLLRGGPQEEGRRAGTENVPGILAMIAALAEREAALAERLPVLERLQVDIIAAIRLALPGARVVGEGVARLWNTIALVMPEAIDCRQRWVVKLDKLGFAVSTGSACASGKERPSHVLSAMGFAPEEAGRVLRLSSGWETTREEWQSLVAGLAAAVSE
jgi:cysteine desulfurase